MTRYDMFDDANTKAQAYLDGLRARHPYPDAASLSRLERFGETLPGQGRPIQETLALLDEVVVPGAFLLAVGRLGNFIEGGVIGSETALPWGFVYPDLEGARHPVALYESVKNFVILPVLIWAVGRWEPGRGVVLSLFVFLYAGLRFAVDLFRDYEAAWLGIGTGQVFNLLMATAGLILLVWTLRFPRSVPAPPHPPARAASWLQVAIFAALVIYPLGIPTSWTRANIAEKRQEVLEDARVILPRQAGYRG